MGECNRITQVLAQPGPNYLQKDVHIQRSCFDTVYEAAGRTLIRLGRAPPTTTITLHLWLQTRLSSPLGFIQLRLGPGAPGSSHLLLCNSGM